MIGYRIQLLRCQQGLSQAELAHILHISTSAIGMYEQGRREPSIDIIISLSRELGVTTDYLLTGRCMCPQDTELSSRVLLHMLEDMQKGIRALFSDIIFHGVFTSMPEQRTSLK